jgi:hypothetical protein
MWILIPNTPSKPEQLGWWCVRCMTVMPPVLWAYNVQYCDNRSPGSYRCECVCDECHDAITKENQDG